jgi:signal transduction histidine kinase
MKSQLEVGTTAFESSELLRLELEASRQRLSELAEQVDSYKKGEALLQGEQHLTEKIARSEPLQEILEEACKLTERALPGSIAVIMLLDGNRLRRGAAPSLPQYILEVDGFEIDPRVGTCSAAAARKERVIVSDITTDPQWASYLDLAAKHGLRSGWATPILCPQDNVFGTFALYWPNPKSPSPQHLQIIDQVVRLLALAMQRKFHAEALLASEKLARGQAEALTQALDALATETNPDKIVEHVLRTVIAQLNSHSDSVWLKDPATELMIFQFGVDGRFKTKHEPEVAAITPSLPIHALAAWQEVFATGKPSFMDVRESAYFPWRATLLERGLIACLWVPMLIHNKVEGLIGVRFTQLRTFRPEELHLAQSLANQAMLAIQMARLSVQRQQTAMVLERNRVARDIHDTLAQGFTGVIAHLEAARGAISQKKTEKISDHLERAGDLAREGLREARRSVQAIRPLALEEKPLTEALGHLIQRMTTGMGMKANLTTRGEPVGLSQEWENNLLRIGQELVTNAIRHSKASTFDVMLAFETTEILLDVQDNGRGFDPAKRNDGFGIRGIRERVNEMGGTFTIQSADGTGTVISIVLPIKTASALGDI